GGGAEGQGLRHSRHPSAHRARRHRTATHRAHPERKCGSDRGSVCRPGRRDGAIMSHIVVTGTDTGIGKTVFSAGLCGLLGTAYWKPVQSGLDGPTDSEVVAELSGARIVPEAYRLKLPASPHQSAAEEGIEIAAAALTPPEEPVVIEGAGGLMVPLTLQ